MIYVDLIYVRFIYVKDVYVIMMRTNNRVMTQPVWRENLDDLEERYIAAKLYDAYMAEREKK